MGRTDITLTTSEKKKLQLGNDLLWAMVRCFWALLEVGACGWMEHPTDPGMEPFPSIWITAWLTDFMEAAKALVLDLDQCMYGQAARKRTRVMLFGLPPPAKVLAKKLLKKQCNHTRHQMVLTGKFEDGTFKTSISQVYPSGLCKALAQVIMAVFVHMFETCTGPMLWETPIDTFPSPAPGRNSGPRRAGQKIRAPPLSSRWTREDRWKLTYMGKWRQKEHTNINELRAVVGLLRHLARSRKYWNQRLLLLCDSLVAIGALSKGRSSCAALLRLCRQAAAHMVAFGFLLYGRYVASEVNCADGPSRGGQVGAAEETKKAHADRCQREPEDAEEGLRKKVQLGRDAEGFAGG